MVRDAFEQRVVEAEPLPEPATATVRSYHPRWLREASVK